ncbi:MAG: grasp-with-spasm system SPASM domain peptide maturase [Cyclobacteriaceae bacterium]
MQKYLTISSYVFRVFFPGIIHNSILDLDAHSQYSIIGAFEQLNRLGCNFIQIRIFEKVNKQYLIDLLRLGEFSFKGVEIIIHASNIEDSNHSLSSFLNILNLNQIVIHGDSIDKTYENNSCSIIHQIINITSESHCGVVSHVHFEANRSLFTESHHFNNCLNNKISIDKHGNICNCPSLPEKFGSIDEHQIVDVMKENQDIRKFWLTTKDQIDICKDCEFRYICTDCRAYVLNGNNSKPIKCNYDPYKGKWLAK